MTNQKVIDGWSIRVMPTPKLGAKLWYDNNMILYSYELPIARLPYPTEIISPKNQTKTTQKHIRMAMCALEERRIEFDVVEKIVPRYL